jgi:hypothetical protein
MASSPVQEPDKAFPADFLFVAPQYRPMPAQQEVPRSIQSMRLIHALHCKNGASAMPPIQKAASQLPATPSRAGDEARAASLAVR